MEAAERQMFKALNGPDAYQEGTGYSFEVPKDVTDAIEAEHEAQRASGKSFIGLNVPAPHGLFKVSVHMQGTDLSCLLARRLTDLSGSGEEQGAS